ncbi:ATP-binding protein [Comamonas thiooxydans]|uniref:ATP-binding protein n=1 Tax=Comamonas thiooxydans TaxID=363952 RepID=UPI00050DAB16|nr:ATP-binding protein [Comamonas thiooxydans]KGH09729.1 hypothetical protein P365_02310 [Comamonas thiooxydans]KGH16180.1 hypothetical protein P368_02310 [Comamonas thiooxydans]TZG10198.1 ATP-binding protein [Comamonas thiooxydans]
MDYDDVVGARASNAGDDFHVLWALSHALRVLDASSDLSAVTVEGIPVPARSGAWEGVDVALFYGGDSLRSATRLEIQQLKYSTTSPQTAWSVARLVHSTRKSGGNNSVMARLATAYAEALRVAPQLSPADIKVKLVSNQPIHERVLRALSASATRGPDANPTVVDDRKTLRKASGLNEKEFSLLAKALDFSECQGPSRFEMHHRVISAIGRIAASESRHAMLELRQVVYTRMLPGDSSPITRAVILGAMFVGDPQALLPCPSQLKPVDDVVPRVSVDVLARELAVQQRVCLHGEGGSGKTTVLQALKSKLPYGSELVVFDCYGAGRYLDSDGQRHLARHALLHLCNEVSARLGVPVLVAASSSVDYVREFGSRLRMASDVVRSRDADALLVIAIDAADNSVTAAQTRIPPERSFVHDVVALGELPTNVRIVIAARTGRLETLRLPEGFVLTPVANFSLTEASEFIHRRWKAAPSRWIEDLHFLSGGNPRVMSYAFDYAGKRPRNALAYLKPSGKELGLIFGERMKEALRKAGDSVELGRLCAGLVALARPIPVKQLAAVLDVTDAHVHDLCNDLAPGLRREGEHLSFADEDFEAFISDRAASSLARVRASAAACLLANHDEDEYCAEHVAASLLAAGERAELLRLVHSHPEPRPIKDPVRRREVQLQRLKLSMRAAREAGHRSEAILVLLRGARALRTDEAVRKMLTDNVDLSARFAQRSLRKAVLQDRKYVGLHGRTLSYLMLDAAIRGDGLRMRDWRRQFLAWLEAYFQQRKESEGSRSNWALDHGELAAEGEAVLRTEGARAGIATLRRWTPKTLMPKVIQIITHRLLSSGESKLVEAVLAELHCAPLWDVTIRVPLALAGKEPGLDQLQRNIGRWVRRGWLAAGPLPSGIEQQRGQNSLIELLLTGAEIVAARRGIVPEVRQVLEVIASPTLRTRDRVHRSSYDFLDATLRAHTLLRLLEGEEATIDSYFGPPKPPSTEDDKAKADKRTNDERAEKIKKSVQDLLPVYNARAKCLVPGTARQAEWTKLGEAVARYGRNDYSMRDEHNVATMAKRIGQSIAAMLHLSDIGAEECGELARGASRPKDGQVSREELATIHALSLHSGTHNWVLQRAISHATAIKDDKAPATDRAERLVSVAKLLSSISPHDSEAIFAEASAVLEDVDVDSIFHLEMLEPLAVTATGALDTEGRRSVSCQLAELTANIWHVLGDHEHFPWQAIVRSLATLDPCVGLAALGRWDDTGQVRAYQTLPETLKVCLSAGTISIPSALALLHLGPDVDDDVIVALARQLVGSKHSADRSAAAEELARLAVLAVDGHNGLSRVRATTEIAPASQSSHWVDRGREMLQFYDGQAAAPDESETRGDWVDDDSSSDIIRAAVLAGGRHITAAEIEATLLRSEEEARRHQHYVNTSEVLQEIRRGIRLVDRRAHVEALAACEGPRQRSGLTIALAEAILEWAGTSPAVASWCREMLPTLVAQRLPDFFAARYWGQEPDVLTAMLSGSGLSSDQVCEALLEGIELHASKWDAASLYDMLAVLARQITPLEAAEALTRHLDKEVVDLKNRDDALDRFGIPAVTNESVARLLYAMLGDADLRVRWNAAHALRAAGRLGQNAIIDAVVAQWDRSAEPDFRDPKAQFYWLAARLWLLIALERIAAESPAAVAKHGRRLFEIATNSSFPHLLCQHFARGGVVALLRAEYLQLSAAEKSQLDGVAKSALPPIPSTGHKGFGRFADQDGRRFRFDSTDTLPYWYDEPLQLFADVSGNEFLDVAESWILDQWKADMDSWMWINERRQHRFRNETSASSHRHGSLPTIERTHTHFEWHAMWCVVGELLQTKPLAESEEGRWRGWEYWWSRSGLTEPPHWLSDRRGIKPLEPRLWFSANGKDEDWLKCVRQQNLLDELGLGDSDSGVVVAGHIYGAQGQRRSTLNISSALVSPETASSLVRALQSIDNAWDYKIPEQDDHLEIDEAPYQLIGWLLHPERDNKIDDNDAVRREVSSCALKPGTEVSKVLGLIDAKDGESGRWIGADGEVKFRYVAWSDDMSDSTLRHSTEFPRSFGHRLMGSKSAIQDFLREREMDLIVEIDLTRRAGDEYGDDDSEERKSVSYDLLIVLRRDGSIETADGCVGTWTASREGTQTARRRGHVRPMDGTPSRGTPGRSKKR